MMNKRQSWVYDFQCVEADGYFDRVVPAETLFGD